MEWLDAVKSALQQLVATYEGQAMTLPEYVVLLEETENAGILVAALKSFGFFRQVGKDMFQLDVAEAQPALQEKSEFLAGFVRNLNLSLDEWFGLLEPISLSLEEDFSINVGEVSVEELLDTCQRHFPLLKCRIIKGQLKLHSQTVMRAQCMGFSYTDEFLCKVVVELLQLIANGSSLENAFQKLYGSNYLAINLRPVRYLHFAYMLESHVGFSVKSLAMLDIMIFLASQVVAGRSYSSRDEFAEDYYNNHSQFLRMQSIVSLVSVRLFKERDKLARAYSVLVTGDVTFQGSPKNGLKGLAQGLRDVYKRHFPFLKYRIVGGQLKSHQKTVKRTQEIGFSDADGFLCKVVVDLLQLIAAGYSPEDAFQQFYGSNYLAADLRPIRYLHFAYLLESHTGYRIENLTSLDFMIYFASQVVAGKSYASHAEFAEDYYNSHSQSVSISTLKAGSYVTSSKITGRREGLAKAYSVLADGDVLSKPRQDEWVTSKVTESMPSRRDKKPRLKLASPIKTGSHVSRAEYGWLDDLEAERKSRLAAFIEVLNNTSVGGSYEGWNAAPKLWEMISWLASFTDSEAHDITFARSKESFKSPGSLIDVWDQQIRYPALELVERLRSFLGVYGSKAFMGLDENFSSQILKSFTWKYSRFDMRTSFRLADLRTEFFYALPGYDSVFHVSLYYFLQEFEILLNAARQLNTEIEHSSRVA